MKNLNHFLLLMLFLSVVSCKKDNITYDEYEIINLFTQQISPPIPPPPPDFKNWDKLAEEKRLKMMEEFSKKDSIEKSKLNFTIYFKDSLTALEKDFKNKLFEEHIGFDEFLLKEIDDDLTVSKKIDLKKLKFPPNIKVVQNIDKESSKWDDTFLGKYWVSRIIFNNKRTKAVVEFNQICGHLCGGGSKVYLSKTGGKWKIIHVFGSWVS